MPRPAILGLLNTHPLASRNRAGAAKRWAMLRLQERVLKRSPIVEYAEGALLGTFRGSTLVAGNHICGLRDYSEMGLVLHMVRPGDLVLDAGANVGIYTVLAARCAGARVIAVEPTPKTLRRLRHNLELNAVDTKVRIVPACLGETEGEVEFAASADTINHIASGRSQGDVLKVPATTIDALCQEMAPVLIKMDIEGYELPALRGAQATLDNRELRAIIIEINGTGKRYGYSDHDIEKFVYDHGFRPYDYEPLTRTLTHNPAQASANRIYLRDLPWIEERIRTSRTFKIHGDVL